MTGLFAQVGKDMSDGFNMYLEKHGGKLGGADVKFIVEDDQAKPDLGVTKAKKLILNDKVHIRTSASSGPTARRTSSSSRSTAATSRPANTANKLTADDATKTPAWRRGFFVACKGSCAKSGHGRVLIK